MATESRPEPIVPPELQGWNVPYRTWLQVNDKHFNGLASAALVFHTFSSADHAGKGETKVLLLQRAPHDSMPLRWEAPGGAVDLEDESILRGCARELWEEAGLVATRFVRFVQRDAGPVSDVFTNRTGAMIFCRFSFEVEVEVGVDGGSKAVPDVKLDPNEHVDWYWASRDEVERQKRDDGRDLPITSEPSREILLKAFDLRASSS